MNKFPIQPIVDGRFVKNRIVEMLLDSGPHDMNSIAVMDFTNEEREQFAQLIGYSVDGFGSLSYVSEETYGAACLIAEGKTEQEAKIEALEQMLDGARKGVRDAACSIFAIHPDDLSETPY